MKIRIENGIVYLFRVNGAHKGAATTYIKYDSDPMYQCWYQILAAFLYSCCTQNSINSCLHTEKRKGVPEAQSELQCGNRQGV